MSAGKKTYKDFTLRQIRKHMVAIDRLVGQPGWRRADMDILLSFTRKMYRRVNAASAQLDELIAQNAKANEQQPPQDTVTEASK